MTNLVISNHTISQDKNGFFSLNDLHKVSGGASKHQPSNFMRNAETQELIKEIELEKSNSSNLMSIAYTTTEGKKGGTFVCRELVYRYAMWISAKFSLMVIRAFDALNTGAIPCLARHTITPAQAYQIQKAVKKKCTHNSVHYQTIYHALYDKFVVSSYKDILASDFKTAMAFIAGFELSVITSNAHISSDIIVRLSEQFFKTSNLIQQVRSEYLPFLENVNSNKGSELNSRLTLLQYDIQGNIRDLFQLLPSDVQNNKQHPIIKKLEMAYYCDDMRYLIHGG